MRLDASRRDGPAYLSFAGDLSPYHLPELEYNVDLTIIIIQIQYLNSIGGHNTKECVRYMLRKFGTAELWSKYSFSNSFLKKQGLVSKSTCYQNSDW